MRHQSPYFDEAIVLLKDLIATPSFSKEESSTADLIADFFGRFSIPKQRVGNNVFAFSEHFSADQVTLLLNSHHDTVKPSKDYTRQPFEPSLKDGKLYGLGSNDAGGCLVSLLAAFLHYYKKQRPFNLVFAASAEEEISGTGGIEMLLPHIGKIDVAIVGEPTKMQMAVAERGLMVIDARANGRAGHAARNEGESALYKALDDIAAIRQHKFERVSDLLGPCQLNVTVIETDNKQHNVVPNGCNYVVDCRINELYSFEEVLDELQQHVKSELAPRSMRLKSTMIALDHPLVQAGLALGKTYYGSPTTSDKALMPFPALKMGPGDSARSHTPDEFIYIEEISSGINDYIALLEHFGQHL